MQLINNTQRQGKRVRWGGGKVLSLLQQDISCRLIQHDDGLQRQRQTYRQGDKQGNCQVMQSAATQEDGGGGWVGLERALPCVHFTFEDLPLPLPSLPPPPSIRCELRLGFCNWPCDLITFALLNFMTAVGLNNTAPNHPTLPYCLLRFVCLLLAQCN